MAKRKSAELAPDVIEPEAPEAPPAVVVTEEPEPAVPIWIGPPSNVTLERPDGSSVDVYVPQAHVGALGRPFRITHPDDGSGTPVVYTQSEIRNHRWIYRSRD